MRRAAASPRAPPRLLVQGTVGSDESDYSFPLRECRYTASYLRGSGNARVLDRRRDLKPKRRSLVKAVDVMDVLPVV
jgi:hypothetical protein